MIFEDPSQKRWKRTLNVTYGVVLLIAGLIFGFIIPEYLVNSKPINPWLFSVLFNYENWKQSKGQIKKPSYLKPFSYNNTGAIYADNQELLYIEKRIANLKNMPLINDNFIHAAFIMQSDKPNIKAIEEYTKQVDIAFLDWISLSGSTCWIREAIDWNLLEVMKKNRVMVFPRFSDSSDLWGTKFMDLIRDPAKAECLANNMKSMVKTRLLKGINIDIDQFSPADNWPYINWLITMAEIFHKDNLYLTVNVPLGRSGFDYKNIWLVADIVVIKAFDEHSQPWRPWPIAGKIWFEWRIQSLLKQFPAKKTIVAVWTHSYDWNITSKILPEFKSFDDTMILADDTKSDIIFDPKSWNSNFKYKSSDWDMHEVWFLDAISAWNEYSFIKKRNVHWFALWRITNEDTTLWNFIPKNYSLAEEEKNKEKAPEIHEAYKQGFDWLWLSNIGNSWQMGQISMNAASPDVKFSNEMQDIRMDFKYPSQESNLKPNEYRIASSDNTFIFPYFRENSLENWSDATFDPKELRDLPNFERIESEGAGEIFKIQKVQSMWTRELTLKWDEIVLSRYVSLPQKTKVLRLGSWKSNTIALTFNNGPGEHTNAILDILKKYNIKATFFLKDENLNLNPKTLLREYREGHMIWSRALFYPDNLDVSAEKVREELNSAQKHIKLISWHWAMLVRAPYNVSDSVPLNKEDIKAMYTASDMGYILAGANIDSRDFTNPWAEIITQNMLSWLKKDSSNIIIMHDFWWDRIQTVQALEMMIPRALALGYEFVPLNDTLGVNREALMPEVPLFEKFMILWRPSFLAIIQDWAWQFISLLFLFSTFIAVLRMIFIGFYVYRAWKIQTKYYKQEFTPPVTILVPAYNEEKVIEKTVLWLLKSDYPNFEILVIDDWSKDATAEVARRLTEKYENVRLISKPNEWKSLALNLGFKEAKHEFIITIDADTIVFPKTVYYIVQPFSDPKVDAVCWNILVWNVKNVLTAFQEVEYVIWQNFDKRAFDALNCISVVPWATWAWRRQKVLDVGWYSTDTLVEDADLTLTVLENWWKIVYSPMAKSVTEAPEKVLPLFKQRFRWSFGTFQCFWKHRHTLWKGSLWNIALPNMLIFQVMFPLLAPLWDLVLLYSLIIWDYKAMFLAYLFFLSLDIIASVIAYVLDKKSLKNVWVVAIQRFFYRQFMYAVTFKSIIAALKWVRYGWNKLERKWTVKISNAG
ncbi:MAG: Glycosyl transferase and polysaccharide deacetylase fusion protein [uncultured bacterium (gcode 4)]|uniref:Glycosyl transferase and polysaccharide deacetylase fusion protein n=1 Tax=uncultured bacterium (gcode 4) TaxID=1234023 RepID=K2GIF5_9BACT|nr:MAG: Glycosyl transferase and polysaccharide deacetylase fusion protein [uncultured bacterium (gcode 4)]